MFKEKIRAQILNGALQDHKEYLGGYCRGYYMTITGSEQGWHITVNANRENDVDNTALTAYLLQLKAANKKLLAVEGQQGRINLLVRGGIAKNAPDVINGVMEPVLTYLTTNRYQSGCGCCGAGAAALGCWAINGEVYYLCDACARQISESLQDNQITVKRKKSKFLPGLVGAILGCLIGCIAWVLIYKLGYIAGIAGLIMGVCALKGYELLGGCLDRKGVVACIILMAAGIFFSNQIAWAWDAYSQFSEYGIGFFDVYQNLWTLIVDSQLEGEFFTDLAIGYGLTALASFANIRNAFRTSAGSYVMKKLG